LGNIQLEHQNMVAPLALC